MIREIALWGHIASGVAGLMIGPIAIRDALLATAERRAAGAFHWLIAVVAASAVVLALLDLSHLWFFVPIAAGSYGLALAGYRATKHRSRRSREAALRGTGGAYIALLTAVLVVSASGFPLIWLLPTIIGAPAIERRCRRFEASLTSS